MLRALGFNWFRGFGFKASGLRKLKSAIGDQDVENVDFKINGFGYNMSASD